MTIQEVQKLNKQMTDAWNSHDIEKLLALCDENIVWNDTGSPEPIKGKKGVREFYGMWNTAFPDFKLTLQRTVADESNVAGELVFSGINSGPLRMPGQPEIPATNKKVISNKGSYFAKVKNGKVTEVNSYPDIAGMMAELGLLHEQHA